MQAASTEYAVFNGIRASSGTPSRFAYTGEQHDPLTGFTHLRARDYDPATGRFTARDVALPKIDESRVLMLCAILSWTAEIGRERQEA